MRRQQTGEGATVEVTAFVEKEPSLITVGYKRTEGEFFLCFCQCQFLVGNLQYLIAYIIMWLR